MGCLARALGEAAVGASKTNTFLGERYRRIARRRGKKKVVLARYVRNKRLADALHHQAFCALSGSPGARAY